MRIFITGSTGFIGTELVKELITAGHELRGLTRSDQGVEQLKAAGAEPLRGTVTDLDILRQGATGMDAVVHLAFDHDFSRFAESAREEVEAIKALGGALDPGKLLVVTSGVAIAAGAPGALRRETDPPIESPALPRRGEQTAHAVGVEKGLRVAVVRLPQVHDTRRQGLVTFLVQIARDKGLSAYVGDGTSRWAAAPLPAVAQLYRLAIEKTGPGLTTYNAVVEEGVPARDMAEAIAHGLNVPARSLTPEQATEHFGLFAHFASLDMPASSEWTRQTLGWNPTGPTLIDDLNHMTF